MLRDFMRQQNHSNYIVEYLNDKNIYVELYNNIGSNYAMLSIGLMVDILNDGEPLKQRITISTYNSSAIYIKICSSQNTAISTITMDEYEVLNLYAKQQNVNVKVSKGASDDGSMLYRLIIDNNDKQLNLKALPFIISIIPRILGSILDTQKVKKHIKILEQIKETKNPIEFEEVLESAIHFDFETIKNQVIRAEIVEILHNNVKQRKVDLTNKLSQIREKQQELLEQYEVLNKEYGECSETLVGVMTGDNTATLADNLCDMLLGNDKIIDVKPLQNKIEYIIKGKLCNYDVDLFEHFIIEKSTLLDGIVGQRYLEQYKSLLHQIFIQHKFEVNISTTFDICNIYYGTTSQNISINLGHHSPEENTIPSPHVGMFNCMGGFAPQLKQALRNNDYVNAVLITIALAQNINWGDIVVVERLLLEMWCSKCITDSDGNCYSGQELVFKMEEENEDK